MRKFDKKQTAHQKRKHEVDLQDDIEADPPEGEVDHPKEEVDHPKEEADHQKDKKIGHLTSIVIDLLRKVLVDGIHDLQMVVEKVEENKKHMDLRLFFYQLEL
uniref:Uncharacterized protein n=1 Tax=Panagrolaimus sp. JU765 TaxID=591449 RepID=A0AC34QAE6_9BILA